MQFTGKIPTIGTDPRKREAKELAQREERIQSALTTDPAFQVRTTDDRHWICPYTGLLIPAPVNNLEPIRQFLRLRQPWSGRGRPRTLTQVLSQKWTLHLVAANLDPRFARFSGEGQWQNPFTGGWKSLAHAHTAISELAIKDIALALALCPEAQKGTVLAQDRLDLEARATTG